MTELPIHHPIIFNSEMVRAILDGHKSQTRRVVKPQPELGKPWKGKPYCFWTVDTENMDLPIGYCPYGQVGDRLWVRETWAGDYPEGIDYKADGHSYGVDSDGEAIKVPWKPSIFMPRWASRITLEITDLRVEKLQDINYPNAVAEGIEQIMCEPDENTNKALRSIRAKEVTYPYPLGYRNYQYRTDKRYSYNPNELPEYIDSIHSFKSLWDSINGKKHPWESNPWVWKIIFKRI